MKIDRSRVRKSTSEVPLECQELIDRLQQCSRTELLEELSKIQSWTFGKCELLHWAQILDVFDRILGQAAERNDENKWVLECDTYDEQEFKLLINILRFTSLLIEHSFSRHLYNSMEHLIVLLGSSDMSVVIEVLNLLYMFSKRSNFLTRLKPDEKESLLPRLQYLSENWGGKDTGFGLADCCRLDKEIPHSATTLHVEFHKDDYDYDTKSTKPTLQIIHIEHIDKLRLSPAEIMKQLVSMYYIPREKEMWLFTHVRLAIHFGQYKRRLKSVQAKLQALSILVYSNAIAESSPNLLHNSLLEELVEVVELQDPLLTDIRCAALRTLTAIIHLDRNPSVPNRRPGTRLNNIIDVTGASQYHGFLPVLVRNCISSLTDQFDLQGTEKYSQFPVSLTTALFSFLYHLASYESGGEALVSCGMMESLLQVINWQGFALDHITFVTRAVRVIDLITNIDMAAFQTHGGLHSFINRLDNEVTYCLPHQHYQIQHNTTIEHDESAPSTSRAPDKGETLCVDIVHLPENEGKICLPQRAALLKSMLNFLKKAFQDSTFAESIRHLMEGTLPDSLKNIIANAEYYGPSLFLLATDVVTVYVYQEPALLSALQDNGLTDIVLHSLLVKDVPATREVLGSLPNVFSALCLNTRGLEAFAKLKPFEKLSSILVSPKYLPAMRRRRSSEPTADTACNLGNAMDELMRHQPSLRQDATRAIMLLLNDLIQLGTDPNNICCKGHNKSEISASVSSRSNNASNEGSSDEEEEDEDETSTSSQNHSETQTQVNSERTPIALVDYILNTMKFIDAILSNNSTDDHCKEFVSRGGIYPLLKVLGLPNLPVDYPTTVPAQAVASVCKSILNLSHEPYLFSQGLDQLSLVLNTLKPLCAKQEVAGGSKLLLELAKAPDLETAFSTYKSTPLLHAMGAVHGYVIMFVHICRTGQTEIRNLSLQHWGSENGRKVLKGLADLYTSLVWESTLLLAYCSDDLLPSGCDVTKEDIGKLNAFFEKCEGSPPSDASSAPLDIFVANPITMDIDPESSAFNKSQRNFRYIKPLLGASSRLGRALAELFGLLVKLCVGSPIRQRRGQNIVAAPPMPSMFARNVASELNLLLAEGLDCDRLPPCPSVKCRLTFLICSVGFTGPMLFDERRYPYHLMLKKFVTLGGQETFFNAFTWAVTTGNATTVAEIQYSALPEGTIGFLDAWLTLLEKMVNPKAILESPHVVSSRPGQNFNFDPLKYLQQVHKLAFESIMILWGKPVPSYCSRITETTLTILRHIFRGERIIKEKMKGDENKSEASTSSSSGPELGSALRNVIRVRNLDDELQHLMDMGFSREHATQSLIHSHNLEQATDYLLSNPLHLSRAGATGQMDVETDDEQMLQAIAMSLGCSSSASPDTKKDTKTDLKDLKKEESPAARQSSFESMLNDFTQDAFDICLNLLDSLPETVHKVCELLVTLMKRNGRSYRDMVLMALVVKIQTCVTYIYSCAFENKSTIMTYYVLTDSELAAKLTNYVHLFILLFEVPSYYDMKLPCFNAINAGEVVEHIIELVCSTVGMLSTLQKMEEPKWLAPCLLLLDAVSKVATSTTRKYYMHRTTTRIWRWYDVVTGKWTRYSINNNQLINEAYWSGEQFVKVTCGRKRYTISFCNMLQMNDETGNSRPISMIPATLTHPTCSNIHGPDIPRPLHISLNDKEEKRCSLVADLSQKQKHQIIIACVKLLHLPVEKNLLHSILQICVRYTRDFALATLFVKEGGVKCLLKMRQITDFGGFGILATILIRHALEEPNTLKYAIEKVIRARTLATIPPPYKDLIYLSRQVGGAVTRSPQSFFQVATTILRIDTVAAKGEDPENVIPLRVEPPSRMKAPPLEEPVSIEVISDLLDALLKPLEDDKEILRRHETENAETSTSENTSTKKNESAVPKKRMLPKSVILKILADAVVSFGPIAKLITDYKYKPDESGTITEETSALAFIFDKILSVADNFSDLDCAAMGRMLVAALASSNHSPEAQITLVSEVKVALTRALSLPESYQKHNQVQCICDIISNMIDNCPLPHASRWTNCSISNIVKLLMRRGIFNDLAKITHYLDLSSPNTAFTANLALKPLESLSRIINQPAAANNSKSRKNQPTADENHIAQSGTSTEGANAHGEEIEDSENTEHDPSSLDNTTSSGELENALEEMMEHILDQRSNDTNQEYNSVPTSRGNMDIDEGEATEELMSTDSGESDSNPSDQVDDEGNDDNEADDENIEDGEENEENNYDEDDTNDRGRRGSANEGGPGIFRIRSAATDEDILMIHYNTDDSTSPRMIRWNETGSFAMPFLEDNTSSEPTAITHPLLISRIPENNQSTASRNQRANRPRRYQYLFNPRNPNPPVILQSIRRLFRPHDPHVGPSDNILGAPDSREAARVVVMDNFGIIPSNEEQIDFVDQSGFLFGPSLAATLSHIPPVLHWWNIESKLLDLESVYDCTTYSCNRLIPDLIKYRNEELRSKKEKEEELSKKRKRTTTDQDQDEYSGETVLFNYDEANTTASREQNKEDDADAEAYDPAMPVPANEEDLDGIPIEISDTSSERDGHTHNDDMIHCCPLQLSFASSGDENSQNNLSETTHTAVQTTDTSDNITQNTDDSNSRTESETRAESDSSNPFELSLPYRCNIIFARPISTVSTERGGDDTSAIREVMTNSLLQDSSLFRYEETYVFDEPIGQQMDTVSDQSVADQVNRSGGTNTGSGRDTDTRGRDIRDGSHDVRDRGREIRGRDHDRRERQTRGRDDDREIREIQRENLERQERELRERGERELRERVDREFRESLRRLNRQREERLMRERETERLMREERETERLTERLIRERQAMTMSEEVRIANIYQAERRANRERELRESRERADREFGEAVRRENRAQEERELRERIQRENREREIRVLRERAENEEGETEGTRDRVIRLRVREPIDGPDESSEEDQEPRTSNERQTHTATENITNTEAIQSSSSNTEAEPTLASAAVVEALTSAQGTEPPVIVAIAPGAAVVSAGPSNDEEDDEEIPEGVDPSFLEALPPEMRREVLEQHRILCLQQRIAAATAAADAAAAEAATSSNAAEQPQGEAAAASEDNIVSPEFLAALPPALQEEVLTHQRLEQQRQAAARANPNEPVDAGAFFETLQPSLRTMILSDMEDSQMSALPPDLAAEAQNLRRDWYARNRQMAQERFLQNSLGSIYRHSRGRQTYRPNNFQRGWTQWSRDFISHSMSSTSPMKIRGRQLLDPEGLACILVLLFMDDSNLNKLRLHRVIRNLCYHTPTREWIINALLSIIEKSVNIQPDENLNTQTRKGPRPGPLSSKLVTDAKHLQNGSNWLTIRMEAALGCAANVFIVNKTVGKKCDKISGSSMISIHPQAAPIVCRNTLDLFTTLAKTYPSCLLPIKSIRDDSDKSCVTPIRVRPESFPEFWDILLRLDSATKKGKSIQKNTIHTTVIDNDGPIHFEHTVFGKLLNMLSSPVVNKNTQLTDNLLKLLSVTTSGMPELVKPTKTSKAKVQLTDTVNNPPTHALRLAVNVITYKNCSEEGLEFITNLLLNLANSSVDMSFIILNLLLNGAIEIGNIVEAQIQFMLKDLKGIILPNSQKRKREEPGTSTSKGIINNRFTNEQVVITASSKVKASCELQLPSMVPLTSKSSSQVFFLRVLRVIVQIRNSIKENLKSGQFSAETATYELPALSEQLNSLTSFWETLSQCLSELEHAPDHHAVLVLQPAVEAFFLVHSPQQGPIKSEEKDTAKETEMEEHSGESTESQGSVPSTSDAAAQATVTPAEEEQQPSRPASEINLLDWDKYSETSGKASITPEQQQFLTFADKHRTVLNQILRQSTAHLADGPFAVLVDHTRILDFDIKRRYFRTELERLDHGTRREETAVHVKRGNIFEDSFRELFRKNPEDWKNRFYIVFEDEEGQDAGGLLREWYVIISRDIFNPNYALFTVSPGDRVTYMINSSSHYNTNHLCYYKFVGRVIAKAIYDNKLLECYFTRSFYKHILGIPVKYTDMESEDYSFYRGLVYLMENHVKNIGLELTFSTEISEFGVTETRDLIPNGRHIPVTEENKMEYVRLVCQMKMTGAIKQQLHSFLEGFYDIIPKRLISIFNEQELELLISGLPNVDIDDLKANTEYHKYQTNSLQIQWFWRALRSFDQADRAKFLQFVTGTSKVPLQGFGALEGMNGVQKFQIHRDDRSTDRLPSAHTCFNQLDLPVYETYDKLRGYLLKAIHECSEGFGFA
ncbi:E3 ubiquitin-protein ligase HUWE1 isoform X3 [Diabrotica virgifera virgifera]|uniref:HECT-type E3 ubiquitin transferase n=1 Tax=Diabrotica virgifera virgifera TaxID=50390 RepID=A0A6P7FV89_DIAVI|nr:E3 ubiquitin-protein ligase HUWE1 isoform X3 [Diabrotica virgifera virgifera]